MEISKRVKVEIEAIESIEGLKLIRPKIFPDDRGFFSETYNLVEWSSELNFSEIFKQVYISYTLYFDYSWPVDLRFTLRIVIAHWGNILFSIMQPRFWRLGFRFEPLMLCIILFQDNHSFSKHNVIRGLHSQPGMGKLVSVVSGKIFDVAVDIRPNSNTFGKWHGEILDGKSGTRFWIPDGFLHGFYVKFFIFSTFS